MSKGTEMESGKNKHDKGKQPHLERYSSRMDKNRITSGKKGILF